MSTRNRVNAARHRRRSPRKANLGQNFLVDASAARRTVDALGDIGNSTVVEIGPGRGALTTALAERAARLVAVEFDEMLARQLQAAFAGKQNVEIVPASFLEVSLPDLLGPRSERAKVVGNIPYYITSDILLRLFEQNGFLEMIVLMVQKEVADRLVARPGSRDYGLLTITAQLFTDIERLFTLPPAAFSPPPQVYSTVLRLRVSPKASALQVDADGFLDFCKLAFSQKRKTLLNNLRGRYEEKRIRAAMHDLEMQENVRAEALSLRSLSAIFRELNQ